MTPSTADAGLPAEIAAVSAALTTSYQDEFGVNHTDGINLPRRAEVIALTEKLIEIIFPGFDGRAISRRGVSNGETTEELGRIYEESLDQISRALHYRSSNGMSGEEIAAQARQAALSLLKALPQIREIMKEDVRAAYSGDPAATGFDEIILCYPGLKAILVQRLAHVLYREKIPLIPRMMTEFVHSLTGIDIHPGARLGRGVFIDHGTGVVIGETAILGDNIRIYQGVTLGAAHFPKDACGMLIKGNKRHPTIGCNVTIYSGASVLGDVTIGDDSVIGGNVWLTESVPPGTKITARQPENMKKTAEK